MKTLKISILVVAVMAMAFSAPIVSEALTGRQIIDKTINRPSGDDQSSDLLMTLENKDGKQRIRKIKQYSKDFGDVEKSIMFFISPADVKNTSFMSWTYDDVKKSDDQWIYLPALRKVKRLSSDGKSDYFMGSDFTYDDLGDRKIDDDVHKLLKEETVNGKACYVVESVSKDEEYMYSKTITWIEKASFVGVKKEFYDEDEDLLKVLTIESYEKVSEIYVVTNSVMKNVQKNHKTIIKLSNVKINSGVSASKFTERMMMRGI